MTWLGLFLIGALALLPLLWAFRRQRQTVLTPDAGLTGERGSALVLYQGQMSEIERDLSLGLIAPEEYESAKLEVQRRLLAADRMTDAALKGSGRGKIAAVVLALPLAGLALYMVNGHPFMPPQPHVSAQETLDPAMKGLIAQLTESVSKLQPGDPGYAQGHFLLAQVEEKRGQTDAAIKDFRMALDAKFNPELALHIAEMQNARDGHISSDSLDLYRRAIDVAPKDAPWRMAVEARIAEGEHQQK